MNILVISQYFYPEQFRVNDICVELVKKGHYVTVVSGVPNYPEGEIFSGYENLFYEDYQGVEVIRCQNRPRHKGLVNLALNYITYVTEATKIVKKLDVKYDIVFVYEISPITMAIPAVVYSKKNKVPSYLYCCDIWPECFRELKDGVYLSKHNILYLFALFISRKIYRGVSRVGIKCSQFKDYLVSTCKVKAENISVLYEHAEQLYLSVPPEAIDNECYDLMYLGNIGSTQICDHIIEAVERIETDKKYLVHFVGNGSCLESLKQKVKNSRIADNVIFHGRHSVEGVIRFYELADCCLLTLSDKTMTGVTLPAKLTGYMAAGKPIVAAAEGATKEIIERAKCGICVAPDDIEGLKNAIEKAINNPDEFKKMGKNGRDYFLSHFTLDIFMDNLTAQLDELIRKGE